MRALVCTMTYKNVKYNDTNDKKRCKNEHLASWQKEYATYEVLDSFVVNTNGAYA